jgi:hypothetical protein
MINKILDTINKTKDHLEPNIINITWTITMTNSNHFIKDTKYIKVLEQNLRQIMKSENKVVSLEA